MLDAELVLRGAKRPLVIGMGGGGDVAGALATAEAMRLYDGAEPLLGGVTWERAPIDPAPGPRPASEIIDARELAPGILLASGKTRVAQDGREVFFAESRMAEFLSAPTVLVDIHGGPSSVADGLLAAQRQLGFDLCVFVDVGGDVLAHGNEPGLRSPLCDAIMLAAAARLAKAQTPVLLGIFGVGCDAELTPDEVLARMADVARAGGLCGARGLTEPVVERLEGAIELVVTEASAQAIRAFRGVSGTVTIRGGTRSLELSSIATVTFYLDVLAAMRVCGRLAGAVSDADSLAAANHALNELGVITELDRELSR